MLKIAELNAFNFGSTGRIMYNIARVGNKCGMDVKTFCPTARMTRSHQDKNNILFGTIIERRGSERIASILPAHDCLNYLATIDLLHKLDVFKPDILHFHNLHGDYVNLKMLFSYAKKKNIKVVWTFHDCWPFTGHCPNFTYVKCEKWRQQCYDCPQFREYPCSYRDDSKQLYTIKKKVFNSISHCTIVTPSEWLSRLIKQSFLAGHETRVINNGIELDKFQPIESDFRKKHNLGQKYIVLGVAFLWNNRKGLDRFLNIASKLDENYQVVLVGSLNGNEDLSETGIIHIERVDSQQKLAEMYSAANVFVNTTYEDNFPTVNIEALACGTPVLTYDVGGAAEIIDDECGETIDDTNAIDAIKRWCSREKPIECCINRAKRYDAEEKFMEYIHLYLELAVGKNKNGEGENQL